MVARRQEQCVVIREAAGDKDRKCSVDQPVSLNRSFGLPVVVDQGVALVGLRRPRSSEDAELGHSYVLKKYIIITL